MSYSKSATNPGLRGPLTDDASRGFSNHCLLLYPNKTVVSTHNVKRNMIKETEDKVFILQENFWEFSLAHSVRYRTFESQCLLFDSWLRLLRV